MLLVHFEDPIECVCVKRPSVHIKSPYVADVRVQSDNVLAHCPSLGLGGLITPGCTMLATKASAGCKTNYVIQAVKVNDTTWVGNVPLHANRIVKQLLNQGLLIDDVQRVKPEQTWGNSRIDFLVDHADGSSTYCEVKSVHIAQDNTAVFPVGYRKRNEDTVSERANKHLHELANIVKSGGNAMVCFVVQRDDCTSFSPNHEDKQFTQALQGAQDAGVVVKVVYTRVTTEGIELLHVGT